MSGATGGGRGCDGISGGGTWKSMMPAWKARPLRPKKTDIMSEKGAEMNPISKNIEDVARKVIMRGAVIAVSWMRRTVGPAGRDQSASKM